MIVLREKRYSREVVAAMLGKLKVPKGLRKPPKDPGLSSSGIFGLPGALRTKKGRNVVGRLINRQFKHWGEIQPANVVRGAAENLLTNPIGTIARSATAAVASVPTSVAVGVVGPAGAAAVPIAVAANRAIPVAERVYKQVEGRVVPDGVLRARDRYTARVRRFFERDPNSITVSQIGQNISNVAKKAANEYNESARLLSPMGPGGFVGQLPRR